MTLVSPFATTLARGYRAAWFEAAVTRSSVQDLADLLEEAKEAHVRYEEEYGPDEDWPRWYAEWLLGVR